jgi:hypothetical protein
MSTATLNVWVGAVGRPCRIGDDQQWFVHILRCDGEIVTWCKRPLTNLKTECGHLEVEVPPGCYVVCATWSPGTSSADLGNHLTHCAIVQAKCGDHVCVNLFTPSLHDCGTWFLLGVHAALQANRLNREGVRAARAVETAVRDLQKFLPGGFAERVGPLGMEARPEK